MLTWGNEAAEKIQVYYVPKIEAAKERWSAVEKGAVRFKKSIMTNELHSIGGNRIQSSVLVDIVR